MVMKDINVANEFTEQKRIDDPIVKNIVQDYTAELDMKSISDVLLLPPDITRKHSGTGLLTAFLYAIFKKAKKEINIDIMPALGTHNPMTEKEIEDMFGSDIPRENFIIHKWREDTVNIGTIPGDFVEQAAEGKVNFPIEVNINKRLLDESYDLIISVGQVLPHEVVGMANFNKNVFVGCGGEDIINKSHYVGAVYGMERLLGRAFSPVRELYNYADENFLPDIPLVYLLTVNSTDINPETGLTDIKGLYFGNDKKTYKKAAKLSREQNITWLENPVDKIVVFLDEEEFKSTWLGCKAIYRTRKIISDGGEIIIIAPGLKQFGEDKKIDTLIRKYGYVGRERVIELVEENEELRANLSVAAHLIHGSSNGRFKVTFGSEHLSAEEIQNVNFSYTPLNELMNKYDIQKLKPGLNNLDAEDIYYVANPATGLWDLEKNR